MSKAWHLDRPGSIDGLVLRETPGATPVNGQVLVRVRAVALNNRDSMIIHDQYGMPIARGRIPLSDCAGDVIATGPGVTRFKIGDRVTATILPDWIGGELQPEFFGSDLGAAVDGVFTQELVIEERALIKIAPHLTFEEGSTLGCAGVTA